MKKGQRQRAGLFATGQCANIASSVYVTRKAVMGSRGDMLDYITPSQSLHREPVISTGAGTALRANRAAACEPVCCLRTQVIGKNRFAYCSQSNRRDRRFLSRSLLWLLRKQQNLYFEKRSEN